MWIQTEKKRIAMPYKYSYDYEEKPYTPPKLQTNRSMWKRILLNIVTLGIYSIFFFIPFSMDPDRIAPKRDHTKTTNYLPAYIVSLFTFQIVLLCWHDQIADRVDEALTKRHILYDFGTDTFWGWYFFVSFILVGPFIYFHKLCTAIFPDARESAFLPKGRSPFNSIKNISGITKAPS